MTESKKISVIISSAVRAAQPMASLPDELADEIDPQPEFELRELIVPIELHGTRLDQALAELILEFSRSYLQQLIGAGSVKLKGIKVSKPASRVKAGDTVSVELRPTLQSQAFKPQAMVLDVVYEDEFLSVINKPAGLVVHPAPGNWSGTLLNGLLSRDPAVSTLPRAGIVHRLDKDTSGLMVVARQRATMDLLVSMIAARTVSRQYLALAHGVWQGTKTQHINLSIGRDPKNRLKMAVVDLQRTAGKTASTDISLIENGPKHCLVKCTLHTGRTHQIRVHMSAISHPLVSDASYGGQPGGGLVRQALHACSLAFTHPMTGAKLALTSELPTDIRLALSNLGLRYNG